MTDRPRLRNRTVLVLAEVVSEAFEYQLNLGGNFRTATRTDWLADMLFAEEFPPQLVLAARTLAVRTGSIKEFVLGLHESGSFAHLAALGGTSQATLLRLASATLRYSRSSEALHKPTASAVQRLVSCLELDGYEVRDGAQVVAREENVLDVEEEVGELRRLFSNLGLEGQDQFIRDLELTDDHYEKGSWGDSIKHARDVLDTALLGVARAAAAAKAKNLGRGALTGVVRAFLRDNGLVTVEENEFLFALYGLLSAQGGHPNMSEREHARICRQYALTATHFILLRCEAWKAGQQS